MRRPSLVALLTVIAVLLAGGTAAALNARVLDPSADSTVGTAESFLPATTASTATNPGQLPAAAPLNPPPSATGEAQPQEPSDGEAGSTSTPAPSHATTAAGGTGPDTAAPRPQATDDSPDARPSRSTSSPRPARPSAAAPVRSSEDGGPSTPDPRPSGSRTGHETESPDPVPSGSVGGGGRDD
jgi:hypothetical protein